MKKLIKKWLGLPSGCIINILTYISREVVEAGSTARRALRRTDMLIDAHKRRNEKAKEIWHRREQQFSDYERKLESVADFVGIKRAFLYKVPSGVTRPCDLHERITFLEQRIRDMQADNAINGGSQCKVDRPADYVSARTFTDRIDFLEERLNLIIKTLGYRTERIPATEEQVVLVKSKKAKN